MVFNFIGMEFGGLSVSDPFVSVKSVWEAEGRPLVPAVPAVTILSPVIGPCLRPVLGSSEIRDHWPEHSIDIA